MPLQFQVQTTFEMEFSFFLAIHFSTYDSFIGNELDNKKVVNDEPISRLFNGTLSGMSTTIS